jgi:hypothetical protein
MPSIGISVTSPVLTFFSFAPLTAAGRAGLLLRPDDLVDHRVPHEGDVVAREQPFLQDLFRTQFVAPVHQRHRLGDVREIERFLDGRVAAADHDHVLAAVEEAVAGRAGRHAVAHVGLFALDAEPFRLGAGGDDQRVGGIDRAAVAGRP